MKRALWALSSIITLFVVFTPALALAQDNDQALGWLAGVGLMVPLIVGLAFYIYWALAFQTIAAKTNTPNGWMAWIPILNAVLLVNIAQKPIWWFILLLIPIVNIVIAIICLMAVAERRGKPSWWGIMVIVPIMNVIMPGYLAWAN